MNDEINEQITIAQRMHVTNARQARKIAKLQRARDYYKKQCEHFKKVVTAVPYLETRYKTYTDRVQERERVKDLERRVQEQELLIRYLSGGKIQSYEIKKFFDEMIKDRHQTLNVK